jgi:hypothetical protein
MSKEEIQTPFGNYFLLTNLRLCVMGFHPKIDTVMLVAVLYQVLRRSIDACVMSISQNKFKISSNQLSLNPSIFDQLILFPC